MKLRWFVLPIVFVLLPSMGWANPQVTAVSTVSLSRPHDVVLSPDGKRLYVADLGNDEIKVLDADSLKPLGAFGGKILGSPHDVIFDARGRLLVADTDNARIAIFAVEGGTGKMVGELKGLKSPEGVGVGPDGSVYVGDTGANAVVRFDPAGNPRSVGRKGDGRLEFYRIHDVEVNAAGRVFVADPGNNRVQILTAELQFVLALEGPDYGLRQPKYLNFDDQGRLWVADQHNNRIVGLDGDFKPVLVLPTSEMKKAGMNLNLPEGVHAKADKLWVSDTYNHRVVLFSLK